jgi:membrane protein DedA with SNARE-associated domain/rhodanese-related sulfurtransferase
LDTLIHIISEYGLMFVFLNILLVQFGAPVPGYPMLMVTGALAARGQFNVFELLGTAVAACLIADIVWFMIGGWMGRRVLRTLCKISLSPDGCVRQTESIFTRFGPPSLLVAKFVPGFASVATALAGAMRIRRSAFLFYDTLGSAIWAGAGLALGWLFAPAIDDIIHAFARLGEWGLIVITIAIAVFVATKWWQRHRFNQQLLMARVSVESLAGLLDAGEHPLIVDVRSALAREDGRIPGAIAAMDDGLAPELLDHPKEALVVVYCACPNDASAVLAARKLLQRGFRNVRPLAGGIDAWLASGRTLEFDAAATGRSIPEPAPTVA